ncbi:hypothetical protein COLO4_07303 [Corchorus olitorius]|uniref:F-box domain-containing protein n=1 Tax=Corchorus olitorius TaxID=93759 RepID=A0A1R3KK91_9ROSI|nr:hypothetical protein COLO4_07303 [Corchorus olitorius]
MKKQDCSSGSDIISTLPTEVIENILSFLPLKDALETSILSKKWQFKRFGAKGFKFNISSTKLMMLVFSLKLETLLVHKDLVQSGLLNELIVDLRVEGKEMTKENQVMALKEKGIPAEFLSSTQTSQPFTSKTTETSSSADNTDPAFLDFSEELSRKTKNLSSTLQKLYLWEKKLYNEVNVYCFLMMY